MPRLPPSDAEDPSSTPSATAMDRCGHRSPSSDLPSASKDRSPPPTVMVSRTYSSHLIKGRRTGPSSIRLMMMQQCILYSATSIQDMVLIRFAILLIIIQGSLQIFVGIRIHCKYKECIS